MILCLHLTLKKPALKCKRPFKAFQMFESLLKVFERVKILCLQSRIPGDGAQRWKTAGNALPELVCAKGAAQLWLCWAAPISCPPGRFHPSGSGTAAGTQPGGGHPAGERHQGQGAAAGAAHRRQEGWHQVGGAAAAERPQRWRAVQGNEAGSGPWDSTLNPRILTGKQNCSGGKGQLAPPVLPVIPWSLRG